MRRPYNIAAPPHAAPHYYCRACAHHLPPNAFYPSDRRGGKSICKTCHVARAKDAYRRPYHHALKYVKKEMLEHYKHIIDGRFPDAWAYGGCADDGPGPAVRAKCERLRAQVDQLQLAHLAALAEHLWQGRSALSHEPVDGKDARFLWWDRGRLPVPASSIALALGGTGRPSRTSSDPNPRELENLVLVTRREFLRYRRTQKRSSAEATALSPDSPPDPAAGPVRLGSQKARWTISRACGERDEAFLKGVAGQKVEGGSTTN